MTPPVNGSKPSNPYRGMEIKYHPVPVRRWSVVLGNQDTFHASWGQASRAIDDFLGVAALESHPAARDDWSASEIRKTVSDYLAMLRSELAGKPYNKAAHRRHLLTQLPARNDSAVEFKHANISAALRDMGLPYVRGYQPRGNYQGALVPELAEQIGDGTSLLELAVRPAVDPTPPARFVVAPTARAGTKAIARDPVARTVDYGVLQAENRVLSRRGEQLVLAMEHDRLSHGNQPHLAAHIEWVSDTRGDGLGYDIGSFDDDGQPLKIEVKTTRGGQSTPFYLSAGELRLARDDPDFRLYRVHDLDTDPKVFVLGPPIEELVELVPVSYRVLLR